MIVYNLIGVQVSANSGILVKTIN